jgi:single-strand DNA-binding protein
MTADPRVKYGEDENHTCFARWTMAVEDRSWKVDDTYHVDFIPCKAIGNVAAVIANTCYKGKELVVSGKMQSGSYEKDVKRHYTMDCFVESIDFCGKKETPSVLAEEGFINIPEEMLAEMPFK